MLFATGHYLQIVKRNGSDRRYIAAPIAHPIGFWDPYTAQTGFQYAPTAHKAVAFHLQQLF